MEEDDSSTRTVSPIMPDKGGLQPPSPLTSSPTSHKRRTPETNQFVKRLRSGATMSPTLPARQSTFPYNHDGDVIIAMSDGKRERVWRLDRVTLESRSPRLRSLFASADTDPLLIGKGNSEETATVQSSRLSVRYFLTPKVGDRSTIPLLMVKPLSEMPEYMSVSGTGMETDSPDSRGPTPDSELIKKSASPSPSSQVSRYAAGAFVAYDCLFSSFYNRRPPLNTNNVSYALHDAELVLALAHKYVSMDSVRPHVGNVLSQFRHRLFEAIAQDPPRWLNLSIHLESTMIYTEAFIHCVSSPAWVWPTTEAHVSKATLSLIKEKGEHLLRAQKGVVEQLLRNTILEGNQPIIDMGNQLETWIVIQYVRDWLVRQLHLIESPILGANVDTPKSHILNGHHSTDRLPGIGALFRQILRGGDAFLPYDKVLKELKEAFEYMNLDWDDLADDLRMLKDHAREIVRDMCKNNLMLNLEEHNIGYLTCTELDAKDFPWSSAEVGGS